jgi:thiol-disulfide isomerase/thioredoxin
VAAVAVVVGAIVAAAVVVRAGESSSPGVSTVPVAAGAVSLSGVDPVTEEQVSLADFAGKPVVVNVWASWCPGCNDEATDLKRLADEHPEAVVIGLDVQDTEEGAQEFYDRWDWEHPSISDPDARLAGELGLQGLPSTFFLDAEHRLVGRIVGAGTFADFEEGLEAAKAASS